MAKITKKQEQQFSMLTILFHELIRAKHDNKRVVFEEILSKIADVATEGEKQCIL